MRDEFAVGQRWVSDADSQMGLGVIVGIEHRTVSVIFPAVGESRIYAKHNAPLIRARFATGDTITLQDGGTALVQEALETGGVIMYQCVKDDGVATDVDEIDLSHFLQLNRAADRLFYGQIDQDKWFRLRYNTLKLRDRLANTPLYGLTGCRVSLIPHQLYIAREVASRYAPRVLLADEVGLGKTIEAGLILHYQLITERAKRVLIVVPESLLHQWLVEMLRRFNLSFSLLDEERCQSLEQSSGQDNPFHTSQLVLCSLDFLLEQPARHAQALEGGWDLLVVDEAHHLSWSPDEVSNEYLAIESLAQKTNGLLLLTATPEQLGRSGHFARLRLLDAHRFPDYEMFVKEEEKYAPVANAVEALFGATVADGDTLQTLRQFDQKIEYQSVAELNELTETQRLEIIERLLDRHGTGRVLFRNTRASIAGFPERTVTSFELTMPEAYTNSLAAFAMGSVWETQSNAQVFLSPELLYQALDENEELTPWTCFDPRIDWLEQTLKENRAHKILIIAASAYTALDIAEVLRVRSGLHAAVFHEHMSLVERDRAAAFFADAQSGSQVLICSEIGSEGRNFQFAHHLIMFDLPLNPDLLEQRIGRLDRIGQTQTIKIMLPVLADSAQAVMFRWYNQGLNAFNRICPAAQSVFESVKQDLIKALHQPHDESALDKLVEQTSIRHKELNEVLSKGRDRLLEYNSCRAQKAQQLFEQADSNQAKNEQIIAGYLDQAYDCFGVNVEPHSQRALILEPGEHMHIPFPSLNKDAMTLTYSREVALANEDMQFVTFEHPIMTGVMEAVTSCENGNTSLVSLKAGNRNAGQLFLETLFVFSVFQTAPGASGLQTNRYLPPTVIRLLLNEKGLEMGQKLTFDMINKAAKPTSRDLSLKIIKLKQTAIRKLLSQSQQLAQNSAANVLKNARASSSKLLQGEVERLQSLQAVNENVRADEIAHLQQQLVDLEAIFDAARVRLDAVRIIVTN